MEYKSLSKLLMAICAAILAVGFALFLWQGGRYYLGILPGVITLITIAVFKDPIDAMYFQKNPPRMDANLLKALSVEYPIISSYNEETRAEFSKRLALFLIHKDGYLVTGETEKLDTYHSALIATPAIIMNMGRENDPYNHIQKLVAYMHAFPSPRMPFIHSAEIDMEDGVAIVSLEQLFMSTRAPQKYYHIVYHLWASEFIQRHTEINFPTIPIDFKERLDSLFPYGEMAISQILGYNSYRQLELAIVAFFTQKKRLQSEYPEIYQSLRNIFEQ